MSQSGAEIRQGLIREIQAELSLKGRGEPPVTPKPSEPTATVTAAQAKQFYLDARAEERAAQAAAAQQARLHRSLDNVVNAVPYGYDADELAAAYREIAAVSPAHGKAYAEQLRLYHPDVAAAVDAEVSLANELALEQFARAQVAEAVQRREQAEFDAVREAAARHSTSPAGVEQVMNAEGLDAESAAFVSGQADRHERIADWKARAFLEPDFQRRTRPRYDENGNELHAAPKLDAGHMIAKAVAREDTRELYGEESELSPVVRNRPADEIKAKLLEPSPADVEMRKGLDRPSHVSEAERQRPIDQVSYTA